MRLDGNEPPIPVQLRPSDATPLHTAPQLERRHDAPLPAVERRDGLYLPLKLRVVLTFAAGLLWLCFSVWLSRAWIRTLGQDITPPLAILVITGIALIPGYLNIQLLTSILVDRPPPLRFDGDFPEITLLIAAYNEQDSIAD